VRGRGRFALGAALGLAIAGCASARAGRSEPIALTANACCKRGTADMTEFAGCRPTAQCRADEPIWMRGAVTCGPVDPDVCLGGRCCRYRTGGRDELFDWERPPAPAGAAAPVSAPAE